MCHLFRTPNKSCWVNDVWLADVCNDKSRRGCGWAPTKFKDFIRGSITFQGSVRRVFWEPVRISIGTSVRANPGGRTSKVLQSHGLCADGLRRAPVNCSILPICGSGILFSLMYQIVMACQTFAQAISSRANHLSIMLGVDWSCNDDDMIVNGTRLGGQFSQICNGVPSTLP